MAFPVALQQFGGCLNSKNYSCLFAVFFHKFPDVDLYFKPYKKKKQHREVGTHCPGSASSHLPPCAAGTQTFSFLKSTSRKINVTTEYPVFE